MLHVVQSDVGDLGMDMTKVPVRISRLRRGVRDEVIRITYGIAVTVTECIEIK